VFHLIYNTTLQSTYVVMPHCSSTKSEASATWKRPGLLCGFLQRLESRPSSSVGEKELSPYSVRTVSPCGPAYGSLQGPTLQARCPSWRIAWCSQKQVGCGKTAIHLVRSRSGLQSEALARVSVSSLRVGPHGTGSIADPESRTVPCCG